MSSANAPWDSCSRGNINLLPNFCSFLIALTFLCPSPTDSLPLWLSTDLLRLQSQPQIVGPRTDQSPLADRLMHIAHKFDKS